MGTPTLTIAPPAGESLDWDGLIRRHNPRVLLSLVGIGVPWGRAAEVAHAAWSRLVESHAAGDLPVVKLPGLAIAQARYLVLEERRQAGVRHAAGERPSMGQLALVPDGRPSPEARAADRQRVERVLASIARAPLVAQRVFQLVYGCNRPHELVAAEVGLSIQRVRQILCELRQQARAALEEEMR